MNQDDAGDGILCLTLEAEGDSDFNLRLHQGRTVSEDLSSSTPASGGNPWTRVG